MRELALLYEALSGANSVQERTAAIIESLRTTNRETSAWLLYFLSGKKIKRLISTENLIQRVRQSLTLPDWLWVSCWQACSDPLEALALLSGRVQLPSSDPLLKDVLASTQNFNYFSSDKLLLSQLSPLSLKLLFQVLTGRTLFSGLEVELTTAVERCFGIEPVQVVEWLFDDWQPHEVIQLLGSDSFEVEINRFDVRFAEVRSTHQVAIDSLNLKDYFFESCLVGKRLRIVKHKNEQAQCWLKRLPIPFQEIEALSKLIQILPAETEIEALLEIYRDAVLLAEDKLIPAIFHPRKNYNYKVIIYDVLKFDDQTLVNRPINNRKQLLYKFTKTKILPKDCYCLKAHPIQNQEQIAELLHNQYAQYPQGVILKHKLSLYDDSQYPWLHLPLPDRELYAVLLYVEFLSFTERQALLTFGLKTDDSYCPIAATEVVHSPEEWKELLAFVRAAKIDKFGPTIQVKPERIYRLAYLGIKINKRKKAGIELIESKVIEAVQSTDRACIKALNDLKREWLLS